MSPETFAEDGELDVPLQRSGKSKGLPKEEPNGVYGLVINGHSLVRKVQGMERWA